MLGNMNFEFQLLEKIRAFLMRYVELHMAFESISNEKKNLVKLGLKTALILVTSFTSSDRTYDYYVAL